MDYGTTATANGGDAVSVRDLEKAIEELKKLPIPDQWIVIDPYGKMYRGKYEQIIPYLLKEHPLLKRPFKTWSFDKDACG
jgi:hypothetical protein